MALLVARGGAGTSAAPPFASPGYGRLPLSFQPNRGQSAGAVRFLATGPGFGLFLGREGAVLDLDRGGGAGATAAVSMRFLGASARPSIGGLGRRAGTVSYLTRGASPRQAGIPTFAAVRYAGLWPGVGARFYGNQRHLEYDFDLAPGAVAGAIRLRFAGQRRLTISSRGALLLDLGGRTLRQPPPRATQMIGGRARTVPSRYVLRGEGRIGFALGPYDHARPLRIDPRLLYSTYLAEGIDGPARDVAVDSSGSAYVLGETGSPLLPVTPGALQGKLPGRHSTVAFVTKLSPDGSRMVYSTYLGGRGGAFPNAIAVDSSGAAYVAGMAYPGGMPTTPGAFQTEPMAKSLNGFVAKLAPSGRRLVYATYLGGGGIWGGQVNGIAVDSQGDAYLAGETESESFPVTPGAPQVPGSTGKDKSQFTADAFVSKLDPTGSRLVYSTLLGGEDWDRVGGIAIDAAGDAYVAGGTASRNLPVTPGALQAANASTNPEFDNAYVAKLDPAGDRFLYVTYLGGSLADEADAIAVDPAGDAYVAGEAGSSDFPTTAGALQRRHRGFSTAFVSVLNPDGNRLLRSTLLGKETQARAIALDPAGDVFLAGFRQAKEQHHRDQGYRGFAAELNPGLSALTMWQRVGGEPARASSLALGPSGGVYVAGGSGPGLRATEALNQIRLGGKPHYPSAFVEKLSP
ncbi:MAG TPA: SBBP repeat-containing protein [Solirubrobacterales bacterium]